MKVSHSNDFSDDIILTDICSKSNKKISYMKVTDSLDEVNIQASNITSWNFMQSFNSVMKDIFLPKGYPYSVSCDYLEYQIWDTCQAFCSSISGALTMSAVMQGFGVGSEAATPLSAAVAWLMKDGTGMTGSILFAWLKGSKLDSDCKKWRLFADILNDIAMFIELSIPFMLDYSMYLLCLATAFKALVGTAGSSTRAAIITHQAIKGNIADVAAKDGSQETCTNICAFVFGIFILKYVTEVNQIWSVMCIATVFHLLFNYKAVKCLKMNVYNNQRFRLSLRTYLPTSIVPSIKQVNTKESVFLFTGISDKLICGYSIAFGVSLKKAVRNGQLTASQLYSTTLLFQNKNYYIMPHVRKKKIFVTFRNCFSDNDVIKAYFHAFLLGISLTFLQSSEELDVVKRCRKNSPIYRLRNILKESLLTTKDASSNDVQFVMNALVICEDFIEKEYAAFCKSCAKEGWNLNKHHIVIDDWRAEWKFLEEKLDKAEDASKYYKNQHMVNFKKRHPPTATKSASSTAPKQKMNYLIIS